MLLHLVRPKSCPCKRSSSSPPQQARHRHRHPRVLTSLSFARSPASHSISIGPSIKGTGQVYVRIESRIKSRPHGCPILLCRSVKPLSALGPLGPFSAHKAAAPGSMPWTPDSSRLGPTTVLLRRIRAKAECALRTWRIACKPLWIVSIIWIDRAQRTRPNPSNCGLLEFLPNSGAHEARMPRCSKQRDGG